MQRFFFDDEIIENNTFVVTDDKHNHISRVLRMSVGESVVFCDGKKTDYICELVSCTKDGSFFRVIESVENETEPSVEITVFQCFPKGEKMDDMVKRCVQFGAYSIVPVFSSRCVVRPDKKGCAKKIDRLNKIARSSAMQSMRGIIPVVEDAVNYKTAISMMKDYDVAYLCYEDEKKLVVNKASFKGKRVAILVGPEGGIDTHEADFAIEQGIECISLGKRILRTEDAAVFAIPIILSMTDNL